MEGRTEGNGKNLSLLKVQELEESRNVKNI